VLKLEGAAQALSRTSPYHPNRLPRYALRSDDTDARYSQGAQGTDRAPPSWLISGSQGRK